MHDELSRADLEGLIQDWKARAEYAESRLLEHEQWSTETIADLMGSCQAYMEYASNYESEVLQLRYIAQKARGLIRTSHPTDVGKHEVVRQWWDALVEACNAYSEIGSDA